MTKSLQPAPISLRVDEVTKSSGGLHVLPPVPGMDTHFFTVDEAGGTFHISGLFTTGDIQGVAPDLRITYTSAQAGSAEDEDLAQELAELRSAASRFDSIPFPDSYDFTDILEP